MKQNEIINRFQLWILLVSFTVGSAVLLIPSNVVAQSKQNGWLSMIIATIIGVGIAYLHISLANLFPNQNLIEISRNLLGKWPSKVIGLLYTWYFLHLSSLILRDGADFIEVMVMPETPQIAFLLIGGLLVYSVIKHGLEVLARSSEIFSFFISIGFWLTVFIVVPIVHPENLLPFVSDGIKPILRGTVPVIAFPFSEVVVFLMIFPYVQKRNHLKKIVISAISFAGIILLITVLLSILVLDILPTSISIYPTNQIARLVHIGSFLTRNEAFIGLTYLLLLFIKLSLSFYASVLALTTVFELKDHRPLITPMVIILVSLAILVSKNIIDVFDFITRAVTPYTLFFGLVIPLLLYLGLQIKNHI